MSRIYDNWERLVGATLLREELRLIAQRTPSDLSLASSIPSPPPSPSPSSLARSSFTYDQILQATDNFSSSNLIMYARTGLLFRGALEAGIRVVVKKVDLFLINRTSLMRELEFYNKKFLILDLSLFWGIAWRMKITSFLFTNICVIWTCAAFGSGMLFHFTAVRI